MNNDIPVVPETMEARRTVKRDVYVNERSSKGSRYASKRSSKGSSKESCKEKSNSSSSSSSSHKSHKRCKKEKRCKTICDKLCLTPPEGACEKKTVTHYFQVALGECKVTRDVKVTHCITANLNHHIKENVLCKHEPCTKYTCEEKHKVDHGCDIDFPECEDDIVFVDECGKDGCDSESRHSGHKGGCKKDCKKDCKKHKKHHKGKCGIPTVF